MFNVPLYIQTKEELPPGKIKGRPKSSSPGQANTSTQFDISLFIEVLAEGQYFLFCLALVESNPYLLIKTKITNIC